jgi:tRNA(fMet)-specific endonuclease VapC
MEQFCISVVSYAEFIYGVEKSSDPEKHRRLVENFILHVDIIPWNRSAAEQYGHIRKELESRGQAVWNMDMMITAHARSFGMTLVTNNERHFGRIAGLNVENWTK